MSAEPIKKRRFSSDFRESCLVVADQCYGPKGTWAYECYAFINCHFFGGRLPWAHIIWGLTEYGSCFAWASTARDKARPPIITLHPAILGSVQKKDPWGIDPTCLGPSWVFDVLLHECMHVHIDYNLGGSDGRTSHDCKHGFGKSTDWHRCSDLKAFTQVQPSSSAFPTSRCLALCEVRSQRT